MDVGVRSFLAKMVIVLALLAPGIGFSQVQLGSDATPGTLSNKNITCQSNTVAGLICPGVQDGSTDDRTALATAITAAGSNQVSFLINGVMVLGSAITIPSNVQLVFTGTGRIKPAVSTTITINGPISAGAWQIFDISNSGALINGKPIIAFCFADWFGASPSATDSTIGLNAIAALAAAAGEITIYMDAGVYTITGTILANGTSGGSYYAPTWIGAEAFQGTQVNCPSCGSLVPEFYFHGNSGRYTTGYTANINFNGSGTSIGILIQGTGGYSIRKCILTNQAEGVTFYNFDAGSFTEFVTVDAGEFTGSVTQPIHYKVGAGNNSFRGTGLTGGTLFGVPGSGEVILIDVGAFVYEAPLYINISSSGSNITIIQSNETTPNANFKGDIAFETSTGSTLQFAAGNRVLFTGTIEANGFTTGTGANITGGTLLRCKTVNIFSDSSEACIGGEQGMQVVASTPITQFSSNMLTTHRLVDVNISGPSYIKRYTLDIDDQGSGVAITPTTVASRYTLDSNTLGSPAFTGNTDGSWNLVEPVTAITFTGSLSSGATGGTLTTNWLLPTGTYPVTFNSGEVQNATLTLNSTAATFTALGSNETSVATASNWKTTGFTVYAYESQLASGIQSGGHIQY